MTARIVIDPGGDPVAGSRILAGSFSGTAFTLSNEDNTGVAGWKWELLDTPVISPTLEPPPGPTFSNTRVVTPDVPGWSILIKLTTYRDALRTLLDGVDVQVLGLEYTGGALNWCLPPAGEQLQVDASRGWSRRMNELLHEARAELLAGGGGTADSLATTGADIDVATASPPTAGQVLTATSATAAEWQDSASGGLGFSQYYPDAPALIPHACDDDFLVSPLDAKHLVWDPSSIATWSVDTTKRMAKATGVCSGTRVLTGLLQQLPASECAIYCKAHMVFHALNIVGNLIEVGLAITGNMSAGPATEPAYIVTTYGYGQITNISQGHRVQTFTNYQTYASESAAHNDVRSYFRIRRNGLSVWFDTSPDGVSWFGSGPGQSLAGLWGFGLVVGIHDFSGGSTGTPWTAYFQFLRVFSGAGSSGFDSTSIGRYV